MGAKTPFKTHTMIDLKNATINDLINSIQLIQSIKDLEVSTNLSSLNRDQLLAKLYCLL